MDYDGSTILGDLNEQTIRQIRESDEFRRVESLHLQGRGDSIELCRHCEMLYSSGYSWGLRLFDEKIPAVTKLARRIYYFFEMR